MRHLLLNIITTWVLIGVSYNFIHGYPIYYLQENLNVNDSVIHTAGQILIAKRRILRLLYGFFFLCRLLELHERITLYQQEDESRYGDGQEGAEMIDHRE